MLNARKDFPILKEGLVYLDTAASAQKPIEVIKFMQDVYLNEYANVHRGSYSLSEKITAKYENVRKIVQKFINAKSEKEIVFTRGATEAINLFASTWGKKNLKAGDEVLLSVAEHHANLVPWQSLRDEVGFTIKFFDLEEDGSFSFEKYLEKLTSRTKLVAFTGMSNVLGTILPIREICSKAKSLGATTLVDACQFVAHNKVDVIDFDCDFLVFSGHKLYGPTGAGVLYGKYNVLESMPPYQFGGDMINKVTYEKTSYAEIPSRFEAGTPAIVEVIGLGKAVEYFSNLGIENIKKHEEVLAIYANSKLDNISGLKRLSKNNNGIFSFVIDGIHSQDIAFILSKENVAVRIGHHCAEPLVNKMGYSSVIRASLGLYSSEDDIDKFVLALKKAITFFKG